MSPRPRGTVSATDRRRTFEERGYVAPLRIFSPGRCRQILALREDAPPPSEWYKGYAAASPLYFALGSHPPLVDLVAELLGDDVILWGASMVDRRPGQVHPWHTDLETADRDGRSVTAWIGLRNTCRESSLAVIPYSHRFGESLQEVGHGVGLARGEATSDAIEAWARERNPRSETLKLDMTDGEVLLFDGRLWHGSDNLLDSGTRTALILQYAAADMPIRIPDPDGGFEWPFRFLERPRPPCIVVRGRAEPGVNRVVDGPTFAGRAASLEEALESSPLAPCWIRELSRWDEDRETGWAIHPHFEGETPCLDYLEVHASVLSVGAVPHPPHRHGEEEIIVPLGGEVEIITAEDATPGVTDARKIGPGAVVYHRARQLHTIRSVGAGPARYGIFKWRNVPGRSASEAAASTIVTFGVSGAGSAAEDHGVTYASLLDLETQYLDLLHGHLTTLQPGAGYAPHTDPYDVGILVLEGTVETLGRSVGPGGVIFYPAGELHGMSNPGSGRAVYLAFEFHGTRRPAPARRSSWRGRLARLARRLGRLPARAARRTLRR